jgi:hypothetical protein
VAGVSECNRDISSTTRSILFGRPSASNGAGTAGKLSVGATTWSTLAGSSDGGEDVAEEVVFVLGLRCELVHGTAVGAAAGCVTSRKCTIEVADVVLNQAWDGKY